MNCEELRALVGAEPDSKNPEALAHIEQCAECARYRQEMLDMDRLIYRALAVDAPTERSTEQILSPPARRNTSRMWRMAASVLVTVLVGSLSIWLLTPRESFAEEVVSHVAHERASMVRTSTVVDEGRLEEILGAARIRLKPGAARVSYAQSCTFRGQHIPHLVVQTGQGPITVLVVPDAPRQPRERINEAGYQGVILPAPRGVIVVLGLDAPVDEVASTLQSALEY